MKLIQTLALTGFAVALSAGSVFAQTTTDVDLSQVQGGDVMYMGITEASTGDGSAFAAGMIQNPEYGSALSVDATVLNASKEDFEKALAADGSVTVDESSIEKTISASGTVNFGNAIEAVDDIDGSDLEVTGNEQPSTSTEL